MYAGLKGTNDPASVMTLHITIPIEAGELERAKVAARKPNVSLEDYLHDLVICQHPRLPAPAQKADVSIIFGIGESDEPTDIAKDRLLGEAVWKEHLRKTRQK